MYIKGVATLEQAFSKNYYFIIWINKAYYLLLINNNVWIKKYLDMDFSSIL